MRVLIVEDEKNLADSLSEIMRQQRYQCDTVYDGSDGYEYARSGIYDCIILDRMLPVIDGFEVLSRIRAERVSTPVLILTALSDVKDKVKGLDLGADDYMTKPFSKDELLARVRTLTRRKGEVILNELAAFDLTLSLDSLELSAINGARIRLSFKEAEILKLFLSAPSVIIPKEDIIVKVWGYDSDAGDNNVEAYISFIRKKLTFVGSRSRIFAVKKLGYRLEEDIC